MARIKRRAQAKGGQTTPSADAPDPIAAPGPAGLPQLSPVTGTNLMIADIVLRAAGGLLKNWMQKDMAIKSYGSSPTGKAKAKKMVEGRGLTTSVALWGASRLARRSPLGFAVVAGGLAAKVFYDRGKRIEAERRARATLDAPSDTDG